MLPYTGRTHPPTPKKISYLLQSSHCEIYFNYIITIEVEEETMTELCQVISCILYSHMVLNTYFLTYLLNTNS